MYFSKKLAMSYPATLQCYLCAEQKSSFQWRSWIAPISQERSQTGGAFAPGKYMYFERDFLILMSSS